MIKEVFFRNPLGYPLSSANIFSATPRPVFFAASSGGSGSSSSGNEKSDEEKKNEEQAQKDEAAKKEKATLTDAEKKKKEEEAKAKEAQAIKKEIPVGDATKSIGDLAKEASGTVEKIQQKNKSSLHRTPAGRKEMNEEKMKGFSKVFEQINERDKAAGQPVKKYVAELVARKLITSEDGEALIEMDPLDKNFDEKWKILTDGLPDLQANSKELKRLNALKIEEKRKQKKIERDFRQAKHDLTEVIQGLSEDNITEGQRNIELRNLKTATGLGLNAGDVLTYNEAIEKDDGQKENYKRYVEIKEVIYEDIPVYTPDGKLTKTIKSAIPTVVTESMNPYNNKIEKDRMTVGQFKKWLKLSDAVESIDSKKQLEEMLGVKIEKKSQFEYLDSKTDDKEPPIVQEDTIEIADIKEGDDKPIFLNKRVNFKGREQQAFSYGEFAQWYRSHEAVPPLPGLKELQNELYTYSMVKNQNDQRNSRIYPAIEVKPNEVLYYDDGSKRDFVIKKIDENNKRIQFDQGKSMSYASFLRWVKKNGVEKKTAESEALKREGELDADPKKVAAAEKEAAQEIDQRVKQEHPELPGKPESKHEGKYETASPDEPAGPSRSYLGRLWDRTHLISLGDFGEFWKTLSEFVTRKIHRWQHGRVGAVGETIFKHIAHLGGVVGRYGGEVGEEYLGVRKHAESEEVSNHTKHMEHQGLEDIEHALHQAANTDILKAAVETMCKKGHMRWEDPHFIERANYLFKGVPRRITKQNYMQDLEIVFDKFWGQDTFRGFKNSQESAYNGLKKNFEDNATRLENDPSGLKGNLQRLLCDFMQDKYVNPAEYEEYIDFSLKNGKMGMEDKMFFIIMGVGAVNSHGKTLMHPDRVAALEGAYLAVVPLLDFFMDGAHPIYDEEGNQVEIIDPITKVPKKSRKPDANSYKEWVRKYILPDFNGKKIKDITDSKKIDWGKSFQNFTRKEIAWNQYAKVRMEKAASDTSRWDHDDMHMFVQLLNEQSVEQITRISGGARQQVSTPGLRNAYVGLNNFTDMKKNMYVESLKNGDKKTAKQHLRNFTDLLRSFVRLDSTLFSRFDHSMVKTRLNDSAIDTYAGVDGSRKVKCHIEEMRAFVGGISKKLGMGDKWDWVMKEPKKEEWDNQQLVTKQFGQLLESRISDYIGKNGDAAFAKLLEDVDSENAAKNLNLKGEGDVNPNRIKTDPNKMAEEEFDLLKVDESALLEPKVAQK